MPRCVRPYIPPRNGEAAHRNNSTVAQVRRSLRQDMKDRESIRVVFDLNVVGDYIPLQSGRKRFPKLGIGINPKAFEPSGNENVRGHLALRVEHASLNCHCFVGFSHIIRNLPIQKTKPITASNPERCASREIKKGTLLMLKLLRHPSLDEMGSERVRGCRPRRNTCVRQVRRHGVASLTSAVSAEWTFA